jgi:Methylase involved in ubiquinone/menaquinone biosynthesis
MTWTVMDVRDLKFNSNNYDLVIDKSTIDALLCGDNSYINVAKMTKEIQRVLKVGGFYMAISYGTPDNRLDHFQ